MAKVLLAFEDVGMAVPLSEELEAQGHEVRWDGARAAGPDDGPTWADAVLLTSAAGREELADAVRAWLDADPPPALLLIGTRPDDAGLARTARIAHLPSTASGTEFTAAIEHAIKVRYAGGLQSSAPLEVALRALGQHPAGERMDKAIRLISAAREADVDMVREALRWHAADYVAIDPSWVGALREHRALSIPEVEFTPLLDGTHCLNSVLRGGNLEPWSAARFVWAVASVGALSFTAEPPDQSTTRRRRLTQTRLHLRARQARLQGATYYDVLEVTRDAERPAIDAAARALALRYGPDRLEKMDLATLTPLAKPIWEEILKARAVLISPGDRARYDGWLATRTDVTTEWAAPEIEAAGAAQMMSRGQEALVDGKLFKAVSDMAAACRLHPHHPDYEASLAWARYRAEVSREKEDRRVIARRERENAETALAGHRPWPRALLALGLLSVAEGDADAARWHLHEALAVDPNLPAASQLLQRIGR